MILYNLTIKIDQTIKEDWLVWMQNTFIPLALEDGLFTAHKLCRLLDLEEKDGITYALQLFCQNKKQLDAFRNGHEQHLQLTLVQQFPNKLIFFPTAMEIL